MRSVAIATVFTFLFMGFPRRFTPRNDSVWAVAITASPFEQCAPIFALLLDSIICFIYNGLAFIYLYIVDSKKIKVQRDGGISS